MTPPIDTHRGAHARIDFVDRGRQYLAGEDYPLAGLSAEKIRRMYAARWIDVGPAPDRKALRAMERREAMEKAKAKASASKAPSPPPVRQQAPSRAAAGGR